MSSGNDSLMPVPAVSGEIDALKQLSPEELERATALAQTLDVTDPIAVTAFAVTPQKELSGLTDQMLKVTRTRDTGVAGAVLSELMREIKSLDVGSFASQVEGVLSRVPVIGPMFNKLNQFISRFETISVKIDRTVVALEKSRNTLHRDIVLLDDLYAQNGTQFRELLTAIAGGELRSQALRTEQAALVDQARRAQDIVLAQQAADLENSIVRLERRLHDLKLAATVCLQTAPQIRLVQNSDQALVDKIQSSILTTIPIWKNQVILAITVYNENKSRQLMKQVSDATNSMLEENAKMIGRATTEAAREAEKGFVSIETLRMVNQNLIDTIDESIKIQEEGRRKRAEVEKELVQLQSALRNKLAEARGATGAR